MLQTLRRERWLKLHKILWWEFNDGHHIVTHRHTVQPTIYDQVPMPHFLLPSKIFFFEPCIWVLKTKHIHKKVLVLTSTSSQRELQRQNHFEETYLLNSLTWQSGSYLLSGSGWNLGHRSQKQKPSYYTGPSNTIGGEKNPKWLMLKSYYYYLSV